MTTKRSARSILAGLLLAVLGATLAGCGGDDESGAAPDDAPTTSAATEQVCLARADLDTAVTDTLSSLRAGNLGDARDGLTTIGEQADALADAVGELADEQREVLEPQIEQVRASLEATRDARRPSELRTALESLGTSAATLTSDAAESLGCD